MYVIVNNQSIIDVDSVVPRHSCDVFVFVVLWWCRHLRVFGQHRIASLTLQAATLYNNQDMQVAVSQHY